MQRTPCSPIVALLLASLSAAVATEARAQPSDPQKAVTAQALYDQAVTAMDQKSYETACPQLEEVVRLIPEGIGAKLTLAQCYESSGRLASAWTAYELAEAAAAKARQAERQQKAHARAEALKPRLARLTIVVPDAVRALPGVAVERDGVPVGAVQWGLPLPVDKGKHVVVVTATGKQRWEKAVEVSVDGATESIEVTGLVDAEPSRGGAEAPVLAQPPGKEPAPDLPAPSGGAQRTAGLVTGGVGLAAIGVGSAFGLIAIGKKNASNDGHCHDGNQCDENGVRLRSEGLTAGTVSTALFIVGGAALVGGVVLFATAPRSKATTARVLVGPQGVELRGTF